MYQGFRELVLILGNQIDLEAIACGVQVGPSQYGPSGVQMSLSKHIRRASMFAAQA